MKKILVSFFLLMGFSVWGSPSDFIKTTLIDHVSINTQIRSGETLLAAMDSIVQIGEHNYKSIFDIQMGFSYDPDSGSESERGGDFLVSGFLKFSPFLEDHVKFPEHWKFLNSLEHGPYILYNFREDDFYGGYQIGLPFNVEPK